MSGRNEQGCLGYIVAQYDLHLHRTTLGMCRTSIASSFFSIPVAAHWIESVLACR